MDEVAARVVPRASASYLLTNGSWQEGLARDVSACKQAGTYQGRADLIHILLVLVPPCLERGQKPHPKLEWLEWMHHPVLGTLRHWFPT